MTFVDFPFLLPFPTLVRNHHVIYPKGTRLTFLGAKKELDGPKP
jgi:hypothetical protein